MNLAEENQYRDAIRTTLFAPLDSVQFDALVGVLRSLRSVRTAEAISPNQMRAVLTEALPALDPRALQFIADTMERIADLEAQLKQARAEIRQLEQSEQQYQRYIDAIIAEEAARLANAQTVFDDHAREARTAEQQLAEAQAQAARVQARREELRSEIAGVRGRLQAAEDALRDHAGAELPHLEERLTDLRKQQSELEAAGLDLQEESQYAAQQAVESVDQFRNSQRHLTGIGSRLRATAADVGAHAFVDRLAEVTEQVTAANSLDQDPPKVDLAQIAETPAAGSRRARQPSTASTRSCTNTTWHRSSNEPRPGIFAPPKRPRIVPPTVPAMPAPNVAPPNRTYSTNWTGGRAAGPSFRPYRRT
ncbi:hypothetical protein GCM10027614_21140 [Micromonospora vulcania]